MGNVGPAGVQTERRLRPFLRRRAMTVRPPLVRMRTRKPCVFLRLRLLGWNVRYIVPASGFRGTGSRYVRRGPVGCQEAAPGRGPEAPPNGTTSISFSSLTLRSAELEIAPRGNAVVLSGGSSAGVYNRQFDAFRATESVDKCH